MSEAWSEDAWRALASELDIWRDVGRCASFWWRDDDGGRCDPALGRLLALAAETDTPLALAVVPAWLAPETADAIRAAPDRVAVLQHGFGHVNHETAIQPGERKVRPAECGAARSAAVVLEEAVLGREALRAAFGSRFVSVFVPPWNRIAAGVVAGLPAAGFCGLSTFRPRRSAEAVPGLLQVNCHADPILWRDGRRFAGAAAILEALRAHLEARRRAEADPAEPTGLLTHHQAMLEPCWAFVKELLARLSSHPAARFPPIPGLFSERAASSTA